MNRKKQQLMLEEIDDAIQAGEIALERLRAIEKKLTPANRWVWLDTIGGKRTVTFIKHRRLSKSNRLTQNAEEALQQFSKKLKNVHQVTLANEKLALPTSLLDYVLGGPLMDVFVQSKIRRNRLKISQMIKKVELALKNLNRQRKATLKLGIYD